MHRITRVCAASSTAEEAGSAAPNAHVEHTDAGSRRQTNGNPDASDTPGRLHKTPTAPIGYQDSTLRSILKALSYRCLGVAITVCVALYVTGELKVAAAIGLMDTIIKLAGYYAHERVWNRLEFGRARAPEYEI